ncbi:hypothetical protein JTB14_003254 [Gonioctena quinquepunctata]|nr:hypothetical protein JTB14_003254 [Gonioctena quinquepunctata]
MTFNFLKCDASGNPDSCEYLLRDYRNDEICKFLAMDNHKNQAWGTFFEYLDKPLKCPLKPVSENSKYFNSIPDVQTTIISESVLNKCNYNNDKGRSEQLKFHFECELDSC